MPREEWRSRGPRGLARGVGCQGKKVAGRRCGKSIEAQPSFGQIKPREVAWDASPDSPGDGWRQAPPTQKGHPGSADSTLSTRAAIRRANGQRSGPLLPSLRCPSRQPRRGPPKRAAPCSTKRSRCHRLRSTLPWSGACAPDSLSWSLCATRSIRPAPLHPERGFARAAPASGIEPIRGETAQPVRAKPKSPARRATPKPALSGILGRVSSNDPGWPIAERQVSNDKRRQKPLAVGRLGAGLDPKLTFGRSAVRQRRWADGCSSARVQHDNQGEKRASIRMRNGLSA